MPWGLLVDLGGTLGSGGILGVFWLHFWGQFWEHFWGALGVVLRVVLGEIFRHFCGHC